MKIKLKKAIQLIGIMVIGIFLVTTVVSFAHNSSQRVLVNSPIPPPEGHPKLSLSTKVVTPTLAGTDGAVLQYNLEIRNTGAYSASDVTLLDPLPAHTVYNDDVKSSSLPAPVISDGVITWEHGLVGFDDSVVITFSVTVTPGYEGIISNTAVISDPLIAEPVSVMTEAWITDTPVFEISKSATPSVPGKSQPLTYELAVKNVGQAADNTPITVTDFLPADTIFLRAGPGGSYDSKNKVINWHRSVDLPTGETSVFTYSVNFPLTLTVGTVITNSTYFVSSPDVAASYGEPFSITVAEPNLVLSKSITPDPPGSNSEVTYTLTVFNLGSKATDLVITDTVPAGVDYRRGGDTYENGIVTWHLPSLDIRESAQVTFTGYISDIAGIVVLNDDYGVCSAEGVCAMGIPVPSLVVGPTFEVTAALDPIAHKPGGGETVTPTITIKNLGPGDALEATALLTFGRISVSNVDVLKVTPQTGTLSAGPTCNEIFPCQNYLWTGDLAPGDMITITTIDGQSTIGGDEGTHYTATVVVTDELGGYVTAPIQATAVGQVTHMSNLIPTKTAPAEIGPGQTMTYTIRVFDSGLSTENIPTLTETVPSNVRLLSISDGGISQTVDGQTIVSWTLPEMTPGDNLYRSFGVKVDQDLVSGTLIVNDQYQTSVYEGYLHGIKIVPGEPVTTTVHEVGLIDSYKDVTPLWSLPGEGNVLTYTIHVVNSGPTNLNGVQVRDIFPWEHTTYQKDAVASAGSLISDIVSLEWTGDLAPYSQELITFTTLVDDFFEGVITNTAIITHSSLNQPVEVSTVAYITDDPVLEISKEATPDPVMGGGTLTYQIEVTNLGQQASLLTITDTVPAGTTYVDYSASSGGQLVDNTVKWNFPVLNHGDTLHMSFQVVVNHGDAVYNERYAVRCAEGVSAYGDPVVTKVYYSHKPIYLPLVKKN